jgi:uncharacterized protein (DUF58 family)
MAGINLQQPQGVVANLSDLLITRFGAKDLKLSTTKPAKSLLAGNQKTRFRGRGMDFEEVRHYQAGDDIRSIDWRVTARTDIPHTKIYREERERPVIILCDQRDNMAFGSRNCFKSVLSAHLTATLSWAALAGGDKIGGLIFNNFTQKDIRPKRSKSAVLEIIHQLIDFNQALITNKPILSTAEPTRSKSLAEVFADLRRIVKPGFSVYIVSDFFDFDTLAEGELALLSRHADTTLFHISDPLEAHLASRAPLTISDGQQQLTIPSHSKDFQETFAATHQQRLDHLVSAANRARVPLISLSTNDNLQYSLHRIFGRKG